MGSIAEVYGAPMAIAIGGIAIGTATLLIWRPLQQLDIRESEPR